jgi:hypothetical protein
MLLIAGLAVITSVGTFSKLTAAQVGNRAASALRAMEGTDLNARIEGAAARVVSNKTKLTYDRQLPTKQADSSTKQNRIAEARRLLDAASKQADQVGGAEPAEHRTQAWGRTKCARCESFSLRPEAVAGIDLLRYLIPDSRMTRPYSIYFLRK